MFGWIFDNYSIQNCPHIECVDEKILKLTPLIFGEDTDKDKMESFFKTLCNFSYLFDCFSLITFRREKNR